MAKGAFVRGTWVEDVISQVYLEHCHWENKEIQGEVRERVRDRIKKILSTPDPKLSSVKRERLSKLLSSDWPGLSIVDQMLSSYRKEDKEIAKEGLEASWSMAILDKKEIAHMFTPEAISTVLKVWKFRTQKEIDFTIREAKWVARLSGINPVWKIGQDLEKLSFLASRYARTELMYKLIKKPFNSTILDKLIMGLPAGINT